MIVTPGHTLGNVLYPHCSRNADARTIGRNKDAQRVPRSKRGLGRYAATPKSREKLLPPDWIVLIEEQKEKKTRGSAGGQ